MYASAQSETAVPNEVPQSETAIPRQLRCLRQLERTKAWPEAQPNGCQFSNRGSVALQAVPPGNRMTVCRKHWPVRA